MGSDLRTCPAEQPGEISPSGYSAREDQTAARAQARNTRDLDTASPLPDLLTVTWTGDPPASGDELKHNKVHCYVMRFHLLLC
jgi:hypothetical protein